MPPGVNANLVKDLVAELTIRSQGFVRYDDLVQFTELYKTIQKLLKAQKRKQEESPVTENDLQNFYKWLADNGFKSNGSVEIAKFEDMGYGLKAKHDLKEGELLLDVPSSVMITEHSVHASKLEPLISNDPLLRNGASLSMALFLLYEKMNHNSFFAPYIKVLPKTFDLPFYFSLDELCELKGSPLRNQCFQSIVVAAKQYCHIYKLLQENPQILSIFSFHFSDFIWAISAVMSRQNRIPDFSPENKNPSDTILALIPFWDFANHSDGYISTYFDSETQSAQCTAMKSFNKNQQVFIYYGSRDNRDLFSYSGFIFKSNKNDAVSVNMSPKDVSDPPALTKRKQKIFDSLGMRSELTVALNGRFLPRNFLLFAGILALTDDAVTTIFGANTDAVKTPDEVLTLLETTARGYLSEKVDKWVRAYPEKDDGKQPEGATATSIRAQNARYMLSLEKRILSDTLHLLQSNKTLDEVTHDPTPSAAPKKVVVEGEKQEGDAGAATTAPKKKKKKSKKSKDTNQITNKAE